jgi:hypothetical protein
MRYLGIEIAEETSTALAGSSGSVHAADAMRQIPDVIDGPADAADSNLTTVGIVLRCAARHPVRTPLLFMAHKRDRLCAPLLIVSGGKPTKCNRLTQHVRS